MDDEYHQDELLRRNSQIADLREELWAAWDRVTAAEERASQLQHGIKTSQAEAGIRRAKANGMEDQADIKQAQGEESSRSLKTNEANHTIDVVRMKHEMSNLDQAKNHVEAEIEQERLRQEQLQVQLATMQYQIDKVRQETQRERIELEREEQDEEERQERNATAARRKGEVQVEAAEEGLADIEKTAVGVQSEVAKLAAEVDAEREHCEGLQTALRLTVEKHREAEERCAILTRGVLTLEAREAGGEVQERLASTRTEHTRLKAEIADVRRQGLLRTQTLQGGIEETRRMLVDHMDQTQRGPPDPVLDVLKTTLLEEEAAAKRKVSAELAEEARCQEMREDAAIAEAAASRAAEARARAGGGRVNRMEDELLSAQRDLMEARRREREAADATRRMLVRADDAERYAQQQEAMLRGKLEEIWHRLRESAV